MGSRRSYHSRKEKTGEIVSHNYAGVTRHRHHQPISRAWFGLNIRIIKGPGIFGCSGIVRHSVQYEAVHPVARPLVSGSQRLKNDQRLAQLLSPLNTSVQCKIP